MKQFFRGSWVLAPMIGWIIMAAVSGQTPRARADSDGYFCAGPNYIAVEFRSFNSPDMKAPHILKVATFGGPEPPEWGGQVEMQDFQPSWMRCDAGQVVIAGWGDQAYVQYRVGRDENGELRVLSRAEHPDKPFGPPDAVLKNLGQWGVPGSYPLESDDPDHTYAIQIQVTERPAEGVIYRDHISELVQFDEHGAEKSSLVLFEGTSEEPIH